MLPRLPLFRRRAHLIAAASLAIFSPTAYSGIMANNVPVQTYRDFAENRGIFAAGTTNVTVVDNNGAVIGTIDRVMNFDSVVDGGWSSLVGGPGFMATVSHNNVTDATFTERFGGVTDSVFYNQYHFVAYNRGWGENKNTYEYDYATPRLNKIVTEAEAPGYLTDQAVLADMNGRQVLRVGGGTQGVVTASGTSNTTVAPGYTYLTGGTINFKSVTIGVPDDGTPLPANTATATYHYNTVDSSPASAYFTYIFASTNKVPSAALPLDMGTLQGDSGSPSWYYNPATSRWEYVTSCQSGTIGGYNSNNYYRSSFDFATNIIDAYNVNVDPVVGGGNITINAPSAGSTAATITQTGMTTVNFVSLANGVHGATSSGYTAGGTRMTAATDAEMNAANNLTLGATGGTLVVNGDIDLGAGYITFAGDYLITGSRLNTAGYDIKAGRTVTSRITGRAANTGANITTDDWRYNIATTTIARDEWRKVGDGKLIIEGNGNNEADLNIGGNGTVELNRTGGYAAHHVLLNGGGATLKLVGANQIGGVMVFGHRGGTLDLYGHDQNWSDILHMDSGARITNTLADNTTTFTFAGTGAKTYLGDFTDGGSLAAGRIKLVYAGGAGNTWNLSGNITHTGGFDIGANGTVNVGATTTLHAGGYVDTTDYVAATFNTGTSAVNLASGSTLAFGRKTTASGNFAVADTATLKIATSGGTLSNAAQGVTDGTTVSGTVALNGANAKIVADVATGFTSTLAATVSGNGKLQKDGAGTLAITGTNTFSGGGLINAGTVTATTGAALGTGANDWTIGNAGVLAITGATTATALGRITTTSGGTLALTASDTTPAALTGYDTLYIGAAGASPVAYGAAGSDIAAVNGGWRLGGGGGELRVDGRLAGTGTLYVGTGYTTGVVTLTNTLNNFTGGITLGGGVDLRYTDILALGGSNLSITYGASASLGPSPAALLAKVAGASAGYVTLDSGATLSADLDFTGKDSLALGANTGAAATYSGTITPGTAGYRFAGAGQLTVNSALTGANAVIVDGQNATGGVITLAGANNFTGSVTVRGYDSAILPAGTGAITLKLGSASALGATSGLALQNGAIVDLNGYSMTSQSITDTVGTQIKNSAATDATLTLNLAASTDLRSTLATTGAGKLVVVKSGAGTLTLSGVNTHTGNFNLTGGTLKLGSDAALGATTNKVIVTGATLDLNGKTGIINAITLGNAGILHNGTATDASLTGPLTLTGNASITGAGDTSSITPGGLTLLGNTLAINSGRLNLTTNLTITAGNITVNNGGIFHWSGIATQAGFTGTITVNAGGQLALRDFSNAGFTTKPGITLDGGVISNGQLDNGGGAQTTIASAITVAAGGGMLNGNGGFGLYLQHSGSLSGTGNLSLFGGKGIQLLGNTGAFTGNIANNTTLSMAGSGTQLLNGVISGAGALRQDGSGTTILAADNTRSGATTITQGTLQIGNGGATGSLGSDTGAIANAGTLAINRSGTLTLANTITGAGALTQAGTGSTILTGASTYTGATTVSSGTLQLGAGATAGSIDGTSGITVSGTGTLAINRSDDITFDRAISGAGHFGKLGANTVTLTGANTYSGTTTVAGGVLNVGTGGTTGAIGSGAVTNNGALVFNRFDAYTLAGAISGTGSLTQNGPGTLTLVGLGDYSGNTTVNAGTLRVSGGTTGTGAVSVASGATLTGSGTLGGIVTLASGATLQNTQGSTLTMGGLILNATSRIEADLSTPGGNALFQVNGDLTLDGGVTLVSPLSLAGTYRLLNYTGTLTDNGLTIDSAGGQISLSTAVAGQVDIHNNGTAIVYWDGANTTANGTIEGGAGTWTTAGTNWTNALGDTNGGLTPATGFAIFTGTAGTVTVDNTGGQVTVNGMQFARSGYTVTGGDVALVNNAATGYAMLRVGDGTAAGSGYTATIASALTGAGLNVRKTDLGTLVFSGNNTYTGSTTVAAGTLRLGSAGAFGGAGALVIDGGATFDANGYAFATSSLSGSGALVLGAATASVNSTGADTFSGTISGSGALVKSGSGTLTLAGANSFTGGVSITGGVLQVSSDLHLGAAPASPLASAVTINGGTLKFGAATSLSANRGITLGASGGTIDTASLANTSGNTVNLNGAITGSGPLTLVANGDMSSSGGGSDAQGINLANTANNFTGDITVTSGLVAYAHNSAFGNAANRIILNGGGLMDPNRNLTLSRDIEVRSGGGTIRTTASTTATLTGAITGDGSLNHTDSGTLNLAGDLSAFTGTFNNRLGSTNLTGAGVIGGNWTIASGTTLGFNASGNQSLAGTISGLGSITKSGSGTLTLTGSNSYANGTILSAGTLAINHAAALGSGLLRINGGTLDNTSAGALTLSTNNAQNWAGNFTFTGTQSLHLGTGAVSIGSASRTVTVSANTLTVGGIVSGISGRLIKAGSGTLALTGANTYSGGTDITDGTVSFASGSLGTSGQIIMNGGTLQWAAGNTQNIASRINFVNAKTAILDTNGNAVALTTAIGGNTSGSLNKIGAGTLTLSGANTYTGGTTVSAGTLAFANGSLGTTGAITMNGGTLQWASGNTQDISSRLTFVNAKTATLDTNGNAVSLTTAFGGDTSGSLNKAGAGVLTLSGANTFTGGVTVSGGSVKLGNTAALGSGTFTVNTTGTAILDTTALTGAVTLGNAIALTNPGTAGNLGINIASGSANTLTLTGVISGGGANSTFRLNNDGVTQTGVKYILAGNNTYAGKTYVFEGGLRLDHANALGTSALQLDQSAGTVLAFGGSMNVANAISYTFANKNLDTGVHAVELSGTQTFTKTVTKLGSGTLTLSGNNTGSGGLTVGAGKVVAGHSSAFGTGAVTVNNGGTLNTGLAGSNLTLGNAITVDNGGRIMGAGTLNSALTLNGIIAPGNSPGSLTLNAGGTFGATSVTEWEFVGNTLATGGVDFDRILVTGGTLTINTGATFKFVATGVDYTNALWDTDRTFLVIDAQGTGNSTGSFVLDTSLAGNFAAEGSWSLVRSGGDVLAKWTGGAIPEPSEYGLMGAGALAAISLIRRRRRKLAA